MLVSLKAIWRVGMPLLVCDLSLASCMLLMVQASSSPTATSWSMTCLLNLQAWAQEHAANCNACLELERSQVAQKTSRPHLLARGLGGGGVAEKLCSKGVGALQKGMSGTLYAAEVHLAAQAVRGVHKAGCPHQVCSGSGCGHDACAAQAQVCRMGMRLDVGPCIMQGKHARCPASMETDRPGL